MAITEGGISKLEYFTIFQQMWTMEIVDKKKKLNRVSDACNTNKTYNTCATGDPDGLKKSSDKYWLESLQIWKKYMNLWTQDSWHIPNKEYMEAKLLKTTVKEVSKAVRERWHRARRENNISNNIVFLHWTKEARKKLCNVFQAWKNCQL